MTRRLALPAILCAIGFGQSRSTAAPETVYLDVTALDAGGRFVSGLTASDFEVSRAGSRLKLVKAEGIDTHLSRTLVLVVDDLGLSLNNLRAVRSALRKFISEQIHSRDRVAIVRTGAGVGHLQRFTSDPSLLNSAIELLQYNPLGDPDGARPQSFASGTLLQLRFVFDVLKDTPGRKAVVLFSDRLNPQRNAGAELLSDIERSTSRIAELAHQGMAALYVIGTTRAAVQLDTGLASVVKETGGLRIDDAAELSAALSRIWQQQNGHYLLGFQPEAPTYDYFSGRNRFPEITVRTIRDGVSLRARSVVYGTPGDEPPDPDDAPRSPFAGEIVLRTAPRFATSATESPAVEVSLHIDAKNLTYVLTSNGEYRCVIEALSAIFDASGQVSGDAEQAGTFSMPDAVYRHTLENGITLSQRVRVRRPGSYQFRSTVRDDATGRIGSASQYIDIPDLAKGDLAVSGIVLSSGNAAHVFKLGDRIGYEFQLFHARAGGQVQARIYRENEEVYAGNPALLTESGSNPTARIVKGSFTAPASLAPGRYRLQIDATDKAGDQARRAMQWVDFEIRR